jgi:hypothetical protein
MLAVGYVWSRKPSNRARMYRATAAAVGRLHSMLAKAAEGEKAKSRTFEVMPAPVRVDRSMELVAPRPAKSEVMRSWLVLYA